MAAPRRDHTSEPSRPITASLRWGLGWTVVLATLGAGAGCASATPIDAPADHDESSVDINRTYDDQYSKCVDALGGMPDAAQHHIDACEVVAAAAAFSR